LPLLAETVLEVWFEHFRDSDRAILLLVGLKYGKQCSAHRQTRSIQSVYQLALLLTFRSETDGAATSLEIEKIGAGRDLPVGLLSGQPYLYIIGLGRGEAKVAGA
jgi:hypothetical protein